jgi:hypothetical protein
MAVLMNGDQHPYDDGDARYDIVLPPGTGSERFVEVYVTNVFI